jgi:hypothetical protein
VKRIIPICVWDWGIPAESMIRISHLPGHRKGFLIDSDFQKECFATPPVMFVCVHLSEDRLTLLFRKPAIHQPPRLK